MCLDKAEIFAVCEGRAREGGMRTTNHDKFAPPSSAVGRPLPRLMSGLSARFRQWRKFSSEVREEVISISVASERGAMLAVGGGIHWGANQSPSFAHVPDGDGHIY